MSEDAAGGGHLNILKHLCADIDLSPWPPAILTLAAGQAECLEWLLRQEPQCPYDEKTLPEVAADGNLPAFQYLRLHPKKFRPLTGRDESVMARAAQVGQLAVIQWLRALVPPVPGDATASSGAAYYGHLSVLQWIHGQAPPCPWSCVCTRNAAFVGELGILQWLRTRSPPCSWDADCWVAAAEQQPAFVVKQIERLQLGQEPPSPTEGLCMRDAAYRQDLKTLQWIQAQTPPCPSDKRCALAAARNHISILKWPLNQDPPCPVHPDCWRPAVCRGDLPMLKLLSKHGCLPTGLEYYEAAWRGHVSILRWLHQNQFPMPRTPLAAPRSNCIPVLLFSGDILVPPPQQSQLILAPSCAPSTVCCAGAVVLCQTQAGASTAPLMPSPPMPQARPCWCGWLCSQLRSLTKLQSQLGCSMTYWGAMLMMTSALISSIWPTWLKKIIQKGMQ